MPCGDGAFAVGEKVDLDFIGTHQPVRRLQQDGRYFMCTDFRKAGTTDQYYDIDFWVNEHGGKMTVDDVKVHKVPEKQQDGSDIQVPRWSTSEQNPDGIVHQVAVDIADGSGILPDAFLHLDTVRHGRRRLASAGEYDPRPIGLDLRGRFIGNPAVKLVPSAGSFGLIEWDRLCAVGVTAHLAEENVDQLILAQRHDRALGRDYDHYIGHCDPARQAQGETDEE
jgi:hypothetical protein